MLTKDRRKSIFENMKPLGEMLKDWRASAGLSQEACAVGIESSRQQWINLENGDTPDVRISTLIALERFTRIPLERLARAAELQLNQRKQEPELIA